MRDKPDHYTRQAKKEGYPARSVYKLQELDQRFGLIPREGSVLDIGASPGSWTLYAGRKSQGRLKLVAVDLKPLDARLADKTRLSLTGDVFSEEIREQLIEYAPYSLVMSDAAPATSGNRTVDCGRSFSLVEGIIEILPELLAPGGSFTAKIFQGGMERRLLERMQTMFTTARMNKPKACRRESFETFLVGTGFSGISEQKGDTY